MTGNSLVTATDATIGFSVSLIVGFTPAAIVAMTVFDESTALVLLEALNEELIGSDRSGTAPEHWVGAPAGVQVKDVVGCGVPVAGVISTVAATVLYET